MTDNVKKIVKYASIGLIVLGTAGAYIGGMTESTTTALVAGVFAFGAILASALS